MLIGGVYWLTEKAYFVCLQDQVVAHWLKKHQLYWIYLTNNSFLYGGLGFVLFLKETIRDVMDSRY